MAGPSIKHIPFVSHTSKVVACATAKFPAFSKLRRAHDLEISSRTLAMLELEMFSSHPSRIKPTRLIFFAFQD